VNTASTFKLPRVCLPLAMGDRLPGQVRVITTIAPLAFSDRDAQHVGMKMAKVTIRCGGKERGVVRLRKGDTAVVFTTSSGHKIEVDLLETASGNLLLRSHGGPVSVAPNDGTLEVSTTV
jgi:hypothetical protein